MPQLPGHLPFCITVAYGRTCEINQFEYAELADAQAMFETFRADARTISVTLSGPSDETIADYDNHRIVRGF